MPVMRCHTSGTLNEGYVRAKIIVIVPSEYIVTIVNVIHY